MRILYVVAGLVLAQFSQTIWASLEDNRWQLNYFDPLVPSQAFEWVLYAAGLWFGMWVGRYIRRRYPNTPNYQTIINASLAGFTGIVLCITALYVVVFGTSAGYASDFWLMISIALRGQAIVGHLIVTTLAALMIVYVKRPQNKTLGDDKKNKITPSISAIIRRLQTKAS